MTELAQILSEKPKELVQDFYGKYLSFIDEKKEDLNFNNQEVFQKLTEQWYEDLEKQGIDKAYDVYGDKNYFVDIIGGAKDVSLKI